ncbi:hypothetical protein [Frondihabitans australicus]|uniref:Type 4 fimbrial biogenesis protein PilX N-terminal domain-containing protein n=1 Tax=Frondihabitans australicus TaxID=386892 RepID=A0A495IK89_9MICO|nr:hypothetical protein [Frondihabitans australicus]RKR75525.1 hypothetical protein C8E83_2673 [Frondihabitans australicus]
MITFLRFRIGRRLARLLGDRSDERGMALATVLIFGAALLLMSATVVTVSVSGTTKAQTDVNWVAAGQAAYAGVEDYQAKLANDNSYSQYGTTASAFSKDSTFTSTNNNPAFVSWEPVDPSNATGPSYRYAVDNTQYSKTGVLRVQSTGKVGTTTRTVVASLKQSGFLDYMYFTDMEFGDPATSTTGCPTTSTYQWAASLSSKCSIIQFAAGDTISGPVHSNDTLTVCGSTFNNTVTTSAPTSTVPNGYVVPSGCNSTPTFGISKPTYTPLLQMPSTIGSLIQETRSDLTASTVPRPGCLYTGPTTFTFNGDGTWTVYSPWTQYTNIAGSPATSGSVSSQCGTPGYTSAGNTLGSPGGQTFNVVPQNLVYVQNVPTTSTDPNYPNTSAKTGPGNSKFFTSAGLPQNYTCTGADGSTVGNGVGFPAVNETAPSSTSYSCKNGDAFVQGTVNGDVTIAANNYVYITGDITYDTATAANDLLGLIGQNNVYVYNPIGNYTTTYTYSCGTSKKPATCTGTTQHTNALLDESQSDRTIDAAIMSVAHSFTVENYSADSGNPKGNLNVYGSIVQKYRGPVATSGGNGTVNTGYTKNYSYDPRLAFEAPPKFLSPVSTTYGITSTTEVKTAFSASGAPMS